MWCKAISIIVLYTLAAMITSILLGMYVVINPSCEKLRDRVQKDETLEAFLHNRVAVHQYALHVHEANAEECLLRHHYGFLSAGHGIANLPNVSELCNNEPASNKYHTGMERFCNHHCRVILDQHFHLNKSIQQRDEYLPRALPQWKVKWTQRCPSLDGEGKSAGGGSGWMGRLWELFTRYIESRLARGRTKGTEEVAW